MNPKLRVLITAENQTRPAMQQVVDDAQRVGKGVRDSTTLAGGGVANLASQFNDIGVMLASGQSPLILAIQQGTQISQVIGPMGAAGAAKALSAAFMAMISPVSLLTIGAIAAGAATVQWLMGMVSGSDDARRSLAELAAPLGSVRAQVDELRQITDAYARAVRDGADGQRSATDSIVADSQREFNAKKSLLELELKRQRAALDLQKADLSGMSKSFKESISLSMASGSEMEAALYGSTNSFSDPRIGQFVRAPYDDIVRKRTWDLADGQKDSPLLDKIKELQANIELAEIATGGLEQALGMTFDEGVAESVATLAGKTKMTREELELTVPALNELQQAINDVGAAFDGAASSAVSGLISDVIKGKEAFDGLISKVGQLGDKLIDMAVNQAIQGLFGSLIGGLVGGSSMGLGGGGFGRQTYGGTGGFFPGFPSFDGGGSTGAGARSGGLDGKGGFLAMLHPKETVVDHARASEGQGAAPVITINIDARGAERGTAPDIACEVRRVLPDAIQAYERNPLRRS